MMSFPPPHSMRLPHNDLEVAGVLGNLTETIEIGQDQVGALVSVARRAKRS